MQILLPCCCLFKINIHKNNIGKKLNTKFYMHKKPHEQIFELNGAKDNPNHQINKNL